MYFNLVKHLPVCQPFINHLAATPVTGFSESLSMAENSLSLARKSLKFSEKIFEFDRKNVEFSEKWLILG